MQRPVNPHMKLHFPWTTPWLLTSAGAFRSLHAPCSAPVSSSSIPSAVAPSLSAVLVCLAYHAKGSSGLAEGSRCSAYQPVHATPLSLSSTLALDFWRSCHVPSSAPVSSYGHPLPPCPALQVSLSGPCLSGLSCLPRGKIIRFGRRPLAILAGAPPPLPQWGACFPKRIRHPFRR